MHVLYVLCLYVAIVILYVLLCCHVRRNKDTHCIAADEINDVSVEFHFSRSLLGLREFYVAEFT